MSTFKEHKTSADRSASDRRRHKQKIEKAIREGVHNIIADESIIGQDGKKKIRIPVRGLKEYRFVYGDNESNSRAGSAPGKDVKRGQKVGQSQKQKKKGDKAGDEKGVEFYDIEISLEELSEYLFKDLELPELEKKKIKKVVSEKYKRKGYRKSGIRPRLDKKRTMINRIKRKAGAKREETLEEDRFTFHQDDLEYKHIKKSTKEASSAVIFFIMDISGSMTKNKKFLARSFYFLIYQFLRHRYENTDIIFISHDTSAYEVNEEQFFTRGSSGGTIASSAIKKVLEVINERYHPDAWNIYCFQCSDGDNWPDDTKECNKNINILKDLCQLYSYCEIEPERERLKWIDPDSDSRLSNAFRPMIDKNFKIVKIFQKEDIWPSFKKIFGGKLNE